MDRTHAHRRPVIIGLAGAAALGAATAGTKLAANLNDGDDPGLPRLQLSSDSSSVDSLTVRLGDDLLPRAAAGSWRSTELGTSIHSMVAFTWTGRADPEIRIRSRVDGRWTDWRRVAVMHDEPDADAAERSATRGTQLLWIGRSDGIHIRVDGQRPTDLSLVLLHPRRLRGDRDAQARVLGGTGGDALMRRKAAPEPALLSREAWGADESWRDASPQYNSTLQQVHVHHTASGNDYTKDDVPALLRGFYRYHTKSLGWSDIGYNFLVDKFGRTWVGRAGGPGKLVRGAHTLGFNATSTGVCVIGNFESVAPNAQIVSAVASFAAWKLSTHGLSATGNVTVVSEGSDKFRARRSVSLPIIDGHRDTNDTACPGGLLYAQLPAIRKAAQKIIGGGAPAQAVTAISAPAIAGTPAPGQALTFNPGSFSPDGTTTTFFWQRNGTKIPRTKNVASYTPTGDDLGATLSVKIKTKRDGYTPFATTVSAPAPVTTSTTLQVRTRGGIRKAAVGVRARGAGTTVPPSGTVTVRLGSQTKTATLANGRALVKFPEAGRGRRKVTVSYDGGSGFSPSSARSKVKVKRRRRRRR